MWASEFNLPDSHVFLLDLFSSYSFSLLNTAVYRRLDAYAYASLPLCYAAFFLWYIVLWHRFGRSWWFLRLRRWCRCACQYCRLGVEVWGNRRRQKERKEVRLCCSQCCGCVIQMKTSWGIFIHRVSFSLNIKLFTSKSNFAVNAEHLRRNCFMYILRNVNLSLAVGRSTDGGYLIYRNVRGRCRHPESRLLRTAEQRDSWIESTDRYKLRNRRATVLPE